MPHSAVQVRTQGELVKYRTTAPVILLAVLASMVTAVPARAASTGPVVRLSGELLRMADQHGPELAALRVRSNELVPINADDLTSISTGSTLTVDVAVPERVRVAASANTTLTRRSPDGDQTTVRLRARDLAEASDGSPSSDDSAIGKATVAEALAPGTAALDVDRVVTAAADPVSTFTPATRRLYVAVASPAGANPWAPAAAAAVRTQVADTSSYWGDVTGGSISMDVASISAQYTSAYSCSDPWRMWNEAASRINYPYTADSTLVVELPPGIAGDSSSRCSYGLGTIGQSPNDWGLLYTADDVWPVLAHELGHNMSLRHADTLVCPSVADSEFSTSGWSGAGCLEQGYGDGQDVMSASPPDFAPFLSAPQSLRTGIIPPAAATVIDAVGIRRVTLQPLASRSGVRVAEVVNPATGVSYYVEYRTPAGRDSRNVVGARTGVRVLRYNPSSGATVLLDPSPSGGAYDWDPTLQVGQTFTSYDSGIRIRTVSASAVDAVVSIVSGDVPLPAPVAPTSVKATAGNKSAIITWAAPDDGGSAITGYTVTASPGGKTVTTDGSTTTTTVAGLDNGTAYTFTVTATNATGTSPASAPSGPVTPATVPSAPQHISARAGTNAVTVQWDTPSSSGGAAITGYTVTASPGGKRVTVDESTRSATVTGLTNGVAYTFTVRATNATGTSTASQPSAPVTPAVDVTGPRVVKVELTPTEVDPSSDNMEVTVTLRITDDNSGLNPSQPVILFDKDGIDQTFGFGQLQRISGDAWDGTYRRTITVPAGTAPGDWNLVLYPMSDVAGNSRYVFDTIATLRVGYPAAPTGVTAQQAAGGLHVSWSAPASDGGNLITGYTVTASPGGKTLTLAGTASAATVVGLTPGTAYTFTVAATNAAGRGPDSAPSPAMTAPALIPAAPTAVRATAGDKSATVTWTAPITDGGSPITGYSLTAAPGGATLTVAGTTRTATLTGLSNGTAYTVTATATNAIGTSRVSARSAPVTPKDRVAPTITLTGRPPTVTTSPTAQFRFAGTDPSDPVTSLRYLCSLDGRTATACTSGATYSGLPSATHTFTVTAVDRAGNSSKPAAFAWRVDRSAPTASMTAPTTGYALSTSLTPAWTTRDVGSGIANVDVRYQRAPYNGAFTSFVYPKTWQKTSAAKLTLADATAGYTYCFSARARDKASNTSPWTTPRCTAVALDDRALSASSGWSRTTGSAYYAGTVTSTTRTGVTLTRTGVQTKGIYLVATRCPTCGSVGVYWNGKLIRTMNLHATTTAARVVVGAATFPTRQSGTLSIRTLTSGKPVRIDGTVLPRQ
jgi:hypothetical protein